MTTDVEAVDLLTGLEPPDDVAYDLAGSTTHEQRGYTAHNIAGSKIVDSTAFEHYVERQCTDLTSHIERRMGMYYYPLDADTLTAFSNEMCLSLAYDTMAMAEQNGSPSWASSKETALSALRTTAGWHFGLSIRRLLEEDLEERRLEESRP
jgi:hypothetical protein